MMATTASQSPVDDVASDTDLAAFEAIARRRRTVRHFRADPLPQGVLERLLTAAHWAPSGYNLQPTHFYVVRGEAAKARLQKAAFNQKQVGEAPVTVVFAGDRKIHLEYGAVLEQERAAGVVSPEYEKLLRRVVGLGFNSGPMGLGLAWKALATALAPVIRLATPFPELPVVGKKTWLSKQVSLAAMNFMLAATAAGLSTVPMEGFDEARVRRACGIPRRFAVLLLVPVGYPAEETPPRRTRVDLQLRVHEVSEAAGAR